VPAVLSAVRLLMTLIITIGFMKCFIS
jgi:hypothetical protein